MTDCNPPNVILIVTDDQGYGDLSCHGNPIVETPAMDQLASESARLEDFHVGTTCAPSRAALMTGRHKLRTGVWHTIAGRSLLGREETTIADAFHAAGYRTGIFGKWHLGDNYPYRPGDRGFEEVFVHGGGGVAQTPDYWGNDYFDDTYFRGTARTPESTSGYCTDVWFDEAMSFIERCMDGSTADSGNEDPFFCYLPTNAPHAPTQVPDRYREAYADAVPERLARFYGMVSNIDDNLDRLRSHLQEHGIADDTILVLMGDNGAPEPVAEHYNAGMCGAKGSPYDGGHRVHCFVRYPGGVDAGRIDVPTRHYDLFPTLADLCGVSLPETVIDGQSLRPLLTGEEDPEWPERTLVVDTQRVERPERGRNPCVIEGRWRLVHGEELYDIDADPGQRRDVSDRHPDVVEHLQTAYNEWWESVAGSFDPERIVVGHPAADPVTLTAHDWHAARGGQVPWNQVQILAHRAVNGHWTIAVERAGTYEITLRRWPPECATPIDAVPDGYERMAYGTREGWTAAATRIDPERAEVQVGEQKRSAAVPAGAETVAFSLELRPGPVDLKTAFIDDDGTERGAYYVTVAHSDPVERPIAN